jgi:hypothetical protein
VRRFSGKSCVETRFRRQTEAAQYELGTHDRHDHTVEPGEILQYNWQFVELRFADGQRVRAHLVDIDPNSVGGEVVYEPIVSEKGDARPRAGSVAFLTCSAQHILEIVPTDGASYAPSVAFRSLR